MDLSPTPEKEMLNEKTPGPQANPIAAPARAPEPHELTLLLEQYKLYVDGLEKLIARRLTMNAFFISINTILLGDGGAAPLPLWAALFDDRDRHPGDPRADPGGDALKSRAQPSYRSELPSLSRILPIPIMIKSMSAQMPRPPHVRSFAIPSPVCPR